MVIIWHLKYGGLKGEEECLKESRGFIAVVQRGDNQELSGWRDGSVVKGAHCSGRGPKFDSLHVVAHNHL